MKNDKFYFCLFLITFLFLFLFLLSIYIFSKITIRDYLTLTGISLKEKQIMIILDKKNGKKIEQNKFLYYKSKKIFFHILEEKKEKDYNFYLLQLSKKVKEGNNINLTLPLTKESLLKILYRNWRLEWKK